jgi:leucyl aminopeptidase
MNNIIIKFVNVQNLNNKTSIITSNDNVTITLNVLKISNYDLNKELTNINNIIKIYSDINQINIYFDKNDYIYKTNQIITKVNDILYTYTNAKNINLHNVSPESNILMNELNIYKNIVMDPNKNPDTYLNYIKSRIPNNYNIDIFDVKKSNDFPLTQAVGLGSKYTGYFVHISPKVEKQNKKNIYLVGKAITFDSGGMNIKNAHMENMKVDMTGSAIIISVLNLLNKNKYDSKYNLHLILPIVENMISNNAVRPGYVITSMNNVKVEIDNTDAEGRLCLADGLEYIQTKLLLNKDPSKCLIIDIATLTGNTESITNGISSIVMFNNKGSVYINKLSKIGEYIGEYIDILKIRKEYINLLDSKVADIKNCSKDCKSGCILAGVFLNYFVNKKIPWIHIDLSKSAFLDQMAQSHGVNLLFEFLKNIE